MGFRFQLRPDTGFVEKRSDIGSFFDNPYKTDNQTRSLLSIRLAKLIF